MFKRIFNPVFDVSSYVNVTFGSGDSVPVDQSPCEDFNIDPATGRPISDITKLLRAQSQYEKEQMLKKLEERPLGDVMTKEQILQSLKYGKPRLAQLPSELADYSEFVYTSLQKEKSSLFDSDVESVEKELLKLNLKDAKQYLRKRKEESLDVSKK